MRTVDDLVALGISRLCYHKSQFFQSIMSDEAEFTTNAQDLQDVANLQARLSEHNERAQISAPPAPATANANGNQREEDDDGIPSVSIDRGAYKYVLVTAEKNNDDGKQRKRTFVYSRRSAKYHCNVAEELVPRLEGAGGYRDIRVKGGGRILRDDDSKKVHIYGYSYGFGRADHAMAKDVVDQSVNYRGYEVTWSNDGY